MYLYYYRLELQKKEYFTCNVPQNMNKCLNKNNFYILYIKTYKNHNDFFFNNNNFWH